MKKFFTLWLCFIVAIGVSASLAHAQGATLKKPANHTVNAPNDGADKDNGDKDGCEHGNGDEGTPTGGDKCCDADDTDGDSGCCRDDQVETSTSQCKCPDNKVEKDGHCVNKPKPKKEGAPGCKQAKVVDPTAPPKSSNCAFVFGTVFETTASASGPCVPAPTAGTFTTAGANCVGEGNVLVHIFNKKDGPPDNPNSGTQTKSSATSVDLTVPSNSNGQYGFLVPAGATYYVCETVPYGEIQTYPVGTEKVAGKKAKSHGEAFADRSPATADTPTGGDATCRAFHTTNNNMRDDEHNNGWYVTPVVGDPLYGVDFANNPSCGPGGAKESGAVSGGLLHYGVEESAFAPLNPLVHDVVSCQIVTAFGL